ncbi:MAG: hypothetical protein HY942_03995 [Gammaproteobacteria bacterium]|nr:hypothetical protein [Gammaproteobacteria bacterium]
MAAAAGLLLAWVGMSWAAVALAAIATGCLGAIAYAWWLARRALKTVERAAPEMTAEEKLRRPRS